MTRIAEPQLGFADLEFRHQGVHLDPLLQNWDYRELRERINDGYTLRGFTDFDSHRVLHYPTDATLLWDTVRTVTRLCLRASAGGTSHARRRPLLTGREQAKMGEEITNTRWRFVNLFA